MYCGNCLRDHTLAVALREIGEDIVLVPTYTPLLTDQAQGGEVHRPHLFFNGIRTYLSQKIPYFRKKRPLFDRLFESKVLVGLLSRIPPSTDASKLGDMTVSMLRGESGNQSRDLEKLCAWLREEKPEIVHLSNALLLGMARSIREATGAPVVCTLSSEDGFLEGLIEPFRTEALDLIRERASDIDLFVAVSAYYRDYATRRLGVPDSKTRIVLSGLGGEGQPRAPFRRREEGMTIGFLARLGPEKGFDILCRAFLLLARRPGFEKVSLRAAGYVPKGGWRWLTDLRRELARFGLGDRVEIIGTVHPDEKRSFLESLDVFALPTRHVEPKGLSVFEALSYGLPLVLPDHGTFPEIVERSQSGLLHVPADAESLADTLAAVIGDDERRRALGEASRRSAEEYFTSERMARETRDLYFSLRTSESPAAE